MGIKKKILLIILVFLMVNATMHSLVYTQGDMEKYHELFAEGEYKIIINELSPEVETFEWNRPKSKLTELNIETARNLIADSYRMLNYYTGASLWYADSIDGYFNSYANYCFELFKRISIIEGRETVFWKCVPFLHYDGRLGKNPDKNNSFRWLFAKIFDETSLEEKRQYFKEMASYDQNHDWVTFLLRFCAGHISLEELLVSVPDENLDVVYTYAGIIAELEGDVHKARVLYKRALSQSNSRNIEQLLAAHRLGLTALKIIYTVRDAEYYINELTEVYGVKSSSTLFDGKRLYSIKGIFDNNPQTAWVEGTDEEGIGEWVEFYFDPGHEIKAMKIINGYAKSEEIYKANNRVKKIELVFDGDKYPIEIELQDMVMHPQIIEFPEPIKAEKVRITILDVYRGTKYNDTCISEIDFE